MPTRPLVELSPLTPTDAPALLSLIEANRAALHKFWWEKTMRSEGDCRTYVERSNDTEAECHLPTRGMFQPDPHRLMGIISLHSYDSTDKSAVVGYWIGREFGGHGYVTEALRQMAQAAFASVELDFETLRIGTRVTNRASRTVAERAGFQLTAIDDVPTWQGQTEAVKTAHYELHRPELVETA